MWFIFFCPSGGDDKGCTQGAGVASGRYCTRLDVGVDDKWQGVDVGDESQDVGVGDKSQGAGVGDDTPDGQDGLAG